MFYVNIFCVYILKVFDYQKSLYPRLLTMKLVIKLFLIYFSCYYFYWMDYYGLFLLLLTNIFFI